MMISRPVAEAATAGGIALLGAMTCYGSLENGIRWSDAGPQPGYFPFYVGLLIILGAGVTFVQALRSMGGEPRVFLDAEQARASLGFLLPIIGFTLISVALGLYVGIFAYLTYFLRVGAGIRLWRSVAAALFIAAINYVIFEKLFGVPLLKGPLMNALGFY